MEQKLRQESKGIWILKSLLVSYAVTGVLLLILAVLLYKLDLDEQKVTMGIIVIYVLSTFWGGIVIGKLMRVRRFVWGLFLGGLYFVLLLLISVGVYRGIQNDGVGVVTTFLLCAGGGMLGGMIS